MLDLIKKISLVPELRDRVLFTLKMLFVCRVGAYIPVPVINSDEVVKVFRFALGGGQNLFQFMDVFSGGAFTKMTVIALGVIPYISASIIMQVMTVVIPSLQREIKENPTHGRRKISNWTKILTLFLAIFQSFLFARQALQINQSHPGVVFDHILSVTLFGIPWLFYMVFIMTMVVGTLFLMWVGDQINASGIGNGTSLVIILGILSSLPSTMGVILDQLNLDSPEGGHMTLSSLTLLAVLFVFIVVGTIMVVKGVRKVPLQYARRGATGSSASKSYIPLKVNHAGVIPVIFASSCLMFPSTIAQFGGERFAWLASALYPRTYLYISLFVAMIIFFTYFWTMTQFRPEQIVSDMKKHGAFIPGIQQGEPTIDYLRSTMNKVTFLGGCFLSFVAILPIMVSSLLSVEQNITHFFGGTTLLILVGVILDTSRQVESHLIMESYDGFMNRREWRG